MHKFQLSLRGVRLGTTTAISWIEDCFARSSCDKGRSYENIYLANVRMPTEKAHGYQIVRTAAAMVAREQTSTGGAQTP